MRFSADAVALENEIHKLFADRPLNQVNGRRGFFFVMPQKMCAALVKKLGGILEFNDTPTARC